jgi:hypothetical protein
MVENLLETCLAVGGVVVALLVTPVASSGEAGCGQQACNMDTGACEKVQWDIDCSAGKACTDEECKPIDPEG